MRPWKKSESGGHLTNQENLERSAWRWMRAYPLRWRIQFGDDLVGVLTDVSGPDVRRVPLSEATQIVRAGWALRLRERPPIWRWLGYRYLDLRLPEQYRYWVMDDLLGRLFGLRTVIINQTIMLPFFLGFWLLVPESFSGPIPLPLLGVYLASLAIAIFPGRRFLARRCWRRFIGTEPPLELQSRSYRFKWAGEH